MGSHHPIRKTVVPEIPDKLYFRIGDVARLCEVPSYVLRFWETEFPQLKPNKGGTGQRLYRKRDVEMALRIKSLLYDQGYTIPGARQVFKAEAAAKPGLALEARAAEPPAADASRKPEAESLSVRQRETAEPAQPAGATTAPTTQDSRMHVLRRAEKLRALRGEMASLAALLARPAGAPQAMTLSAVPAPPVAFTPMRPRLAVVERPKS